VIDDESLTENVAIVEWIAETFPQANLLPGDGRCAQKLLRETFRMAEDFLGDGEWFFGDFSLADGYFFWCFRRATIFKVDLAEFSRCQAHLARMSERASVKALLAFEAKTLVELRRAI